MIYANGKEFVKDFATRTLANYEKLEIGPFEVTQLINSSIGLLFIPKENSSIDISDSFIDGNLLQKLKSNVTKNTYPGILDLCQLVRHMRNAIGHGRMEFVAAHSPYKNKPLEIEAVKLRDQNWKNPKEEFEIELTIDLLREFFIAFAKGIIANI